MLRVRVDQDRCCGAGNCARIAPEVFGQNEEDGLVIVLDAEPAAELHDEVEEAAEICPAGVISLERVAERI